MPIYEYECNKCLLRFEVKRSFSENGGNLCPQCGSEGRQIYSPTPLIFKGSGFYITDSRKNTDQSSDGGQPIKPDLGKPTAKPDPGKPATKSESDKPKTKPESDKKESN
jgi:putative FmdB family regulatory protein